MCVGGEIIISLYNIEVSGKDINISLDNIVFCDNIVVSGRERKITLDKILVSVGEIKKAWITFYCELVKNVISLYTILVSGANQHQLR